MFEKEAKRFGGITVILTIEDLFLLKFSLEEPLIIPVIANATLYRIDSNLFRRDSLNSRSTIVK